MAVKNLESLVLRGVRVLNGVPTNLERIGSYSVGQEPSITSLSFARHLFTSAAHADADAGTRWASPCPTEGKHTADRAGRLARSAGVLDSRCPARFAGQAIPSGWQLVLGLRRGLTAMAGLTRFLAGMQPLSMRGSLICLPRPSGVKNRIPPVQQQLQPLYCGTFTTY
jgi:hypothetical protein